MKSKPWLWFVIGSVFTLIVCYLCYRVYKYSIFDFVKFGTIGDAVGGILGAAVALFSIYFIYRAYTSQIDANEIIKTQGEGQIAELQISNKILKDQGQSLYIQQQFEVLQKLKIDADAGRIVLLSNAVHVDSFILLQLNVRLSYILSELLYTFDIVDGFSGSQKDYLQRKLKMIYYSNFRLPVVSLAYIKGVLDTKIDVTIRGIFFQPQLNNIYNNPTIRDCFNEVAKLNSLVLEKYKD